jgi:hypothetical protein
MSDTHHALRLRLSHPKRLCERLRREVESINQTVGNGHSRRGPEIQWGSAIATCETFNGPVPVHAMPKAQRRGSNLPLEGGWKLALVV